MLKPKGIKVLGTMAMVRNSIGGGNIINLIIVFFFNLTRNTINIICEKVKANTWKFV